MERFDMNQWAACPRAPTLEALTGLFCFIGIAMNTRCSAVQFVFPAGPEGFVSRGFCNLAAGEPVDTGLIEREVKAAVGRFEVLGVGYDPWESTHLATRLEEFGVPMKAITPTFATYSRPVARVASAMSSRTLYHDSEATSLMTKQMANVVFRYDRQGRLRPGSAHPGSSICGPIALFFAVSLLCEQELLRNAAALDAGVI